jgi:hypothetical protein
MKSTTEKRMFRPVPDADEAMRNFNRGLHQVLRMSKDDLAGAMAREKASHAGKLRRGPKKKIVHSEAAPVRG